MGEEAAQPAANGRPPGAGSHGPDGSSLERTHGPGAEPPRRTRWGSRLLSGVAVAAVSLALVLGAAFLLAGERGPSPAQPVAPAPASVSTLDPAAASPPSAAPAAPSAAPATEATGAAGPAAVAGAPAVLRREGLDALLDRRAAAVLARDEQAWLATVDPAAGEFRRRQAEVFAHLADVPVASWRYEFAGDGPALSAQRRAELGAEATTVRVVLAYRLAGADTGDVRREQTLTLTRRDGRWLIAGDGDGRTAADLWDLGQVSVVRGERSLVLGTAPAADLQRYAQETDEAARQVDRIWGAGWPRTVVVQVPSDQQQMARLLVREDAGALSQVAAVTTGELGLEPGQARANRVVVNPVGFAQLGPLGRSVVLSHEVTHVATRAVGGSDVPIWLSEGFADYVAYSGTGLDRAVVAADVLELVRTGDGPTALPDRADFDPATGDIAPAYSGSWLACELLERRHGRAALLEVYRQVSSGRSVDAALRIELGTDRVAFEREWLAYLDRLAR